MCTNKLKLLKDLLETFPLPFHFTIANISTSDWTLSKYSDKLLQRNIYFSIQIFEKNDNNRIFKYF